MAHLGIASSIGSAGLLFLVAGTAVISAYGAYSTYEYSLDKNASKKAVDFDKLKKDYAELVARGQATLRVRLRMDLNALNDVVDKKLDSAKGLAIEEKGLPVYFVKILDESGIEVLCNEKAVVEIVGTD